MLYSMLVCKVNTPACCNQEAQMTYCTTITQHRAKSYHASAKQALNSLHAAVPLRQERAGNNTALLVEDVESRCCIPLWFSCKPKQLSLDTSSRDCQKETETSMCLGNTGRVWDDSAEWVLCGVSNACLRFAWIDLGHQNNAINHPELHTKTSKSSPAVKFDMSDEGIYWKNNDCFYDEQLPKLRIFCCWVEVWNRVSHSSSPIDSLTIALGLQTFPFQIYTTCSWEEKCMQQHRVIATNASTTYMHCKDAHLQCIETHLAEICHHLNGNHEWWCETL